MESPPPASPGPRTLPRAIPRAMWLALAGLLLALMVWVSGDYGVTWDEVPRQAYGERIWQLYQGQLGLDDFKADRAGSHLYGGLFDVTAVALQKLLPVDAFRVRHGLNAAFGWACLIACGLLAARLGGGGAGLLALVLLAVTPRFWGDAMNNPKDLPFAACATAALALMASLPATAPVLPLAKGLAIGVAVGLALAVRPGGVLLLGYLGVVVLVQTVRSRRLDTPALARTAGALGLAVAVAVVLPMAVWPWLQTRPVLGLWDAVAGVSRFEWRGTMLFDGEQVHSMRLPWSYVPVWLLYTTPLVTLAGLVLALRLLLTRSAARLAAAGLLAAALFPVVYVIARQSTLYDGIRHLLFVQPMLAALAALGWRDAVGSARPLARRVALGLLVAGVAEPLWFDVREHPNQIVYFNPLAGGPRGAQFRFELDYWGNCLLQAQQAAAGIARQARMPVVVSGHRWRQMHLNAARLPEIVVSRPEARRHHLEIVLLRTTREEIARWRRHPGTVARVETTDGALLCTVVPGPAYQELQARLSRWQRTGQSGSMP